jgi:hypothetical protein
LGCRGLDPLVDADPVRNDRRDDSARELTGAGIGLDLGQLPLQDRDRGALPEIGLEHGGERDPPPGPQ